MRFSIALVACCWLLSSCSLVERLALEARGSGLDSSKIYLGDAEVVGISSREVGRYACVGTPVICESHGVRFSCRCP